MRTTAGDEVPETGRSLNTALSGVKNSAYPSPREKNFTAGSVWPWLASKLKGRLMELSLRLVFRGILFQAGCGFG